MVASSRRVRFVCVSDTHNHAPGEGYTLPKGDVLIHAGDLTNQGSAREFEKAAGWLRKADFPVKLVVAGNHDLALDAIYNPSRHSEGWQVVPDGGAEQTRQLLESIPGLQYLEHTSCEVSLPDRGIFFRVFGSPYSPYRAQKRQNWAFQYLTTSDEAEQHHKDTIGTGMPTASTLWEAIPEDTDVLITHTPPAALCDASTHWDEGGCHALKAGLARVKPVLHVCGHCHEGRGAEIVHWLTGESGTRPQAEIVRTWQDPGQGNRKQSLLDLTGARDGASGHLASMTVRGRDTTVVNASIMAKSWSARGGSKAFNKPIVVDVDFGPRHD